MTTATAEAVQGTADVEKEETVERTPIKNVRLHMLASMAASLIPVPLFDFAALTVIQLNMIRKLASSYGIPFSKGLAKNIIASLAGGLISTVHARPLAACMAKYIPVVGQVMGILAMPILAGATTYAVGKVFIQHFASGGTFLTFNPEKVKDYYGEMFQEGKKAAADMKKGKA